MSTFSSIHQPARRGYGSRESTYDLDALHRLLWLEANSKHRLTTSIGELADRFDVPRHTLARALAKLAEAGKIKPLGREGNSTEFAIRQPN